MLKDFNLEYDFSEAPDGIQLIVKVDKTQVRIEQDDGRLRGVYMDYAQFDAMVEAVMAARKLGE